MIRVEILSRAGKATGIYKHACSLHDRNDGNLNWIDLKKFELKEELSRESKENKGNDTKVEEDEEREEAGMAFIGRRYDILFKKG